MDRLAEATDGFELLILPAKASKGNARPPNNVPLNPEPDGDEMDVSSQSQTQGKIVDAANPLRPPSGTERSVMRLVNSIARRILPNRPVDSGDCTQRLELEAIIAERTEAIGRAVPRYVKRHLFRGEKIVATLPKMAKAAQSPDLRKAFEKAPGETETHIARLEKVFAAIDKKLQAKTYEALVGITDEGAEIMKDYKNSPALDAGLLAAAQAVDTMRCHVTTRSRPGRRNSA